MKQFLKNIGGSRWVMIFLVLVTVIIYLMNLIVPFFNDDLGYQYYQTGKNVYEHYSSIWQVFHATYLSYFDGLMADNGRLACTFFIRLYTGILGETAYDVINTIIFLFLILYIGYYCIPRGKEKFLECWVAIVGCLFIFTQGTRTFSLYYWAAGAGTYLWASIWVITFLLTLQWAMKHRQAAWWQYILLILGGTVCGLGHEMFSFALSASCFFYFLVHRNKITKPLAVLLIVFMIFSLINAFSPAIQARGGFSNGEFSLTFMGSVKRFFSNLIELKAFYIMLVCLYWFKRKEEGVWTYIRENSILFMALLFSFIPPLLFGSGGRALFGIEIFSTLLLTKLIGTRELNNKIWSKVVAAIFFVYFGIVTYESYKKWDIVKEVVEKYYHSDSETQYFDVYSGTPLTDYYSIDMTVFLANELTRTRYGNVKRIEYGHPESVSLHAVPSKRALDIIRNSHEKLDARYKIPGNANAYDYPELDFLLLQCDSTQLEKFYAASTVKKRHLKCWPHLNYNTSSSHKYDSEINEPDLKYRYVLLRKSFPFMTYDEISY